MNLPPPDELADGLIGGDPAIWKWVFRHFAPEVWNYAARRMAGKAAASVPDVVQETMLAAARGAANFDPKRGTLWQWFRGITQKQIALAYRNLARHDVLSRSENEIQQTRGQLARWLNDAPEAPSDILSREETAQAVREVLAGLPADYGDLLTAKYIDQQSVDQIARQNDMTATSVQSKLARARKAFREAFEHDE